MKAILEFDLPDDQHEFELAIQGAAMYSALWDISQELRTMTKYEELNEAEWNIAERIREKFYDILSENNVKLDK